MEKEMETTVLCWIILGLYWVIIRLYWGYIGVIVGLYGDNGKENGNYYNGLYMDYGVPKTSFDGVLKFQGFTGFVGFIMVLKFKGFVEIIGFIVFRV